MALAKLREFLDSRHVKYVVLAHSRAFTAQEIAHLAHVPGQELAKTVMVRLDGGLAMAVVTAQRRVDLALLKELSGSASAELAHEPEFAETFPGCELGAMPPFGNLYGIPVYADEVLAKDERIAFNAGSHTELIQMAWADFAALVEPKVGRLTR